MEEQREELYPQISRDKKGLENQKVFFSIICVNPCLSADKNSGFYFGFLLEIAIFFLWFFGGRLKAAMTGQRAKTEQRY
ncbi:MAG: hypothetical protein WC360_03810 [Opitutales bacterium]